MDYWTLAQQKGSLAQVARFPAQERRRLIIEATLSVATRRGLGATTVREVATEMGSSSGLIHHYFESMDSLLAEAFEMAAGTDLAHASDFVDLQQGVSDQLAAYLTGHAPSQTDSTMQLWLDAWSEAARRPPLREVSRRLNLEWLRLLTRIIEAGVTSGEFRCPDPTAAAWRILSVLDGMALQVVAHGTIVNRSDAIAWSVTAASAELDIPLTQLEAAVARVLGGQT